MERQRDFPAGVGTPGRNGLGNPVHIRLTSGNIHDVTEGRELAKLAQGENFIADKAYDADDIHQTLNYSYTGTDNVLSKTSSLGNVSRAHVGESLYDSTRPHAVTGDAQVTIDASFQPTS